MDQATPALALETAPAAVVALPWKAETKYHTWPMGWDKDTSEKSFATREELDAYLAEMQEWSLSEDNKVHIQIFHNDRPYLTRQFG